MLALMALEHFFHRYHSSHVQPDFAMSYRATSQYEMEHFVNSDNCLTYAYSKEIVAPSGLVSRMAESTSTS